MIFVLAVRDGPSGLGFGSPSTACAVGEQLKEHLMHTRGCGEEVVGRVGNGGCNPLLAPCPQTGGGVQPRFGV